MSRDHDSRLGLKHFCFQNSDVKENPASRGLRLPWAPPAGELDSGEKRSPLRF